MMQRCNEHLKSKNGSKGFTIVELLIATAVFSLVLLVAITGFIQVGRMFYKSIEVGKTQDTAGNILDSVTTDLRSLATNDGGPVFNLINAGDYTQGYTCIGIHRYTYFLGQGSLSTNIVNLNSPPGPATNEGLIRDNVNKGDCPALSGPGGLPISSNSQQMLGDGMSLGRFYIYQPNAANLPDLFGLQIQVGFGDNGPGGVFGSGPPYAANLDQPGAGDSGPPATQKLVCRGAQGTNFCAVTNLDTFVKRGLQIQ